MKAKYHSDFAATIWMRSSANVIEMKRETDKRIIKTHNDNAILIDLLGYWTQRRMSNSFALIVMGLANFTAQYIYIISEYESSSTDFSTETHFICTSICA